MTKRLKIVFIIGGSHEWTGGHEYIENLIIALGKLSNDNINLELCVLTDEKLSTEIQQYIHTVYKHQDLLPTNFTERQKWKLNRFFSADKKPHFDSFLKKEKIDFIYPYFSHEIRVKPYRSAAWIADFQHKHLPEYFSASELKFRDEYHSEIVRTAEKVILSSEDAKEDCHRFFPASKGKTFVMPFCTVPAQEWYKGNPFDIQKKYNLPDKFLIVSNQFWQHKNHLLIFEALQILQKQSIFPTVVCTGQLYDFRCPDYSNKVLRSVHESGLFKQLILLGLIPKTEQIQLLRRSIAIIQPSIFEGWSTIVENARCFAKPVILSDIPVHREQDLADSIFFNCRSAEELAEKISTVWNELPVGPDTRKENLAFKRQQKIVSSYGKRFLEITQLI